MGNDARNAEIPDYSLFLCSCQLERGKWALEIAISHTERDDEPVSGQGHV